MPAPEFIKKVREKWQEDEAGRIFTPVASYAVELRADDKNALAFREEIIQELCQQRGTDTWGFSTDRHPVTDDRVVRFDFKDPSAAVYFAVRFLNDPRVKQVEPAAKGRTFA